MGFDIEPMIGRLRKYFLSREEIGFALLFGSYAKGTRTGESDLDIAIYFKPNGEIELEDNVFYPQEEAIWTEIERLAGIPVDLVVLNRAPSTLAAAVFHEGIPLSVRDERLYRKYFLMATDLAEEYRAFAEDFRRIKSRSYGSWTLSRPNSPMQVCSKILPGKHSSRTP